MKHPFNRGVRSPLYIPLFPLNGQRRWSEAAAGEVIDENSTDVESQMRRWSMPWEAVKSDQNTVTWYQTRIMPINNMKVLNHKTPCSDRSVSNTPGKETRTKLGCIRERLFAGFGQRAHRCDRKQIK
ncbi:uncharacterized protein LOC118755015 isoform X1 [Rhagoletis pomonella]|uniref:uncharacterized protein LOC118755015 isoform X1 n=1 Tax=Rhagoletis pomonella TaxID=28610 RepID=UPI001780D2AE|nr:uncharacterized protein LOC118755015 isoform X1 [Rhagoletis pomonella]